MEPGNQQCGTVFTFLTGALVGVGVALLFTPQSGTEIRGLLRDWASRTKETFDDAIERGAEEWENVNERGRELIEQGKESLSEAGRQAKGFAEEGKS